MPIAKSVGPTERLPNGCQVSDCVRGNASSVRGVRSLLRLRAARTIAYHFGRAARGLVDIIAARCKELASLQPPSATSTPRGCAVSLSPRPRTCSNSTARYTPGSEFSSDFTACCLSIGAFYVRPLTRMGHVPSSLSMGPAWHGGDPHSLRGLAVWSFELRLRGCLGL